jgi:tetratricopeptide (TPR) repeat protein
MERRTAATNGQRPDSVAAAPATESRRPLDDEGLETRELGSSLPGEAESEAPSDPGTALGRYFPIEELGRGGMGRVLRAYDPKLQREVALKVLNANAVGALGWARMVREAQTMARLNHPNVVAIYDVDDDPRHGVVLAMELVEGTTLREWLRERPRRWDEILEAFIEAGRGLAAAHHEGLLHRDFKPANVLVARDRQGARGLAKVTDFGLAKRSHDDGTASDGLAAPVERPGRASLGETLTEHGTVMGTPFYMAPEQHRGAPLTSAADQYAFCVALWEALFGVRPFDGRSPAEIAANVLEGRLRPPPKGHAVPGWLRRACERGLAVEPRHRWPSMDALLGTLAKGRTRARMRKGLVAVGALVLLGAAGVGYRRYALAQRIAACEASGDEVRTAWSPAREHALREALLATGASYAATTADKVVPVLERQAAAWRELRIEACLDADVRERWDADTLDRSLWCLDERRTQLESLVDELTLADAEVLQKAVTAAVGLTSVAPCGDASALQGLAPPPADSRPAIRAVRDDVTRATNLQRAGRYDKALALARGALMRAEELQWRPLSASARYRLGALLDETGSYAQAEAILEDAYFEADQGAAPEVAFDASVDLVGVVGYHLARHGEGRRWSRHAESALAELHGDDGLRRSRLLTYLAYIDEATSDYEQAQARYEQALALREATLGPSNAQVAAILQDLASLHKVNGHYEQAKALGERALAIDQQALGPDHPYVAGALSNLATVLQEMGAYDESRVLSERAVAILERALGPDHLKVGIALNNLASVFHATGAIDEAVAVQERVVAILTRSLGPEHPQLAKVLSNLAALHEGAGAYERAEALNRQALAIREKALGPDHPDVATSLDNLANAYQDSPAEGLVLRERALAIREKVLGPDHPDVALSLTNIAGVHQAAGNHAEAIPRYERAVAVFEKAMGPDHPYVSDPLIGLAQIAIAEQRPGEAVPLAERALARKEQSGSVASALAFPRFVLAQALWAAPVDGGRDRARAVRLAEQAREGHAAAKGSAEALAEVEGWLREHGEG